MSSACQYTLGYYPSNAARDGKFRKIKVETANHDLKVLARKGYYAPKGDAALSCWGREALPAAGEPLALARAK